MLCKKYANLSHVDKIRYLGELIHIVQNDDEFFDMGSSLINKAKSEGLLDGVKILPEVQDDNDNQ